MVNVLFLSHTPPNSVTGQQTHSKDSSCGLPHVDHPAARCLPGLQQHADYLQRRPAQAASLNFKGPDLDLPYCETPCSKPSAKGTGSLQKQPHSLEGSKPEALPHVEHPATISVIQVKFLQASPDELHSEASCIDLSGGVQGREYLQSQESVSPLVRGLNGGMAKHLCAALEHCHATSRGRGYGLRAHLMGWQGLIQCSSSISAAVEA